MHDAWLTLCWCMGCLCSKGGKNAVSVFCGGWPLWAKSIKTNRGLTSDLANPWATLRRKKNRAGFYLYSQLPSILSVLNQNGLFTYICLVMGARLIEICVSVPVCMSVSVSVCQQMQNEEQSGKGTLRHYKKDKCPQTVCRKSFLYPKALTIFLDFHLNSWEKDQRWIALFSQCLWSANSD